MNEQFYELPEEKRLRIINAGLEVFSQNDYKRAVTDEIAAKAGISKALLFYYFHNKKSLYLFLLDYCSELIVSQVTGGKFREITDFFELMDYAAKEKLKVLEKNPYLSDFIVRCMYSGQDAVENDVNRTVIGITVDIFDKYFANADFGKFREDVDPREIYHMLVWMTEGYIHEKRWAGQPVEVSEIMDRFCRWEQLMRQVAYRDEFQERGK